MSTTPSEPSHALGLDAEAERVDTLAREILRESYRSFTVEEMELIGPTVAPTDLLVRLFHEEGPRVFDAQPVHFGCSCSPDKVRSAMSIYSAKDIRHMTTPQGTVTADCQFCGAHYIFDPKSLGFEAEKGRGDGA